MNENTGNHAAVNGLDLYYEINGEARLREHGCQYRAADDLAQLAVEGFTSAQRGS
jgi:hypothetical protein